MLNGFANFLLRLIGIKLIHGSEIHTEEELKIIIQESADSGAIQEIEQNLTEKTLYFWDITFYLTEYFIFIYHYLMNNIKKIKEDIDHLFNGYYQIFAGNVFVPEVEKEKLLSSYEKCIKNAQQIIANLLETEKLLQNTERLN